MRMKYAEWRETVEALRAQWRTMWRERIDDKVRAEGIANQNFPALFVEQGAVIVASRECRPPDFEEILDRYRLEGMTNQEDPPHPSSGGYGKFIKDVIVKQTRYGLEDRSRSSVRQKKEKTR